MLFRSSFRSQLSFQGENAFVKHRPLYLEIGFGNGLNLVRQAEHYPSCNFIGCEIYESGIGSTLINLKNRAIDNVRIAVGDALETIEYLSLKSLDGVFILFPDPWPKKKHKKRRLVNENLLTNILSKLRKKGKFFFRTDNLEYYNNVIKIIKKLIREEKKYILKKYISKSLVQTKYHKKAHKFSNEIKSLELTKK